MQNLNRGKKMKQHIIKETFIWLLTMHQRYYKEKLSPHNISPYIFMDELDHTWTPPIHFKLAVSIATATMIDRLGWQVCAWAGMTRLCLCIQVMKDEESAQLHSGPPAMAIHIHGSRRSCWRYHKGDDYHDEEGAYLTSCWCAVPVGFTHRCRWLVKVYSIYVSLT